MFNRDYELTAEQARRLSENREYVYIKNKIYRKIFSAADNGRSEVLIDVPEELIEHLFEYFTKVNYNVTKLRDYRLLIGW